MRRSRPLPPPVVPALPAIARLVGRVRVVAMLVGLAALAGRAAPARAQPALGLNVHQSTGVGLDVTRDARLRIVRIDLNWLDVEPQKGRYQWGVIDAVVDGARARGLEVLAVIGYGPAWASSGDGRGDGSLNDVPIAGAYATFVGAAVKRYRDRVTRYELWNEPNLTQFFDGTPQQYVERVLVPGADAVHAACPACQVVAPGLASIGGKYDVWLDAALAAAATKIDVVSGHVYAGFGGGAGTTSDSFLNKLESHRVVKVGGVTVFEGPLSFREVMMKRGVDKPFWLTETGEEARLGDAAAEAKQAAYYQDVLAAMATRPWWTTTIFYESYDEPGQPYLWGVALRDGNGYRPKAAFGVLQRAGAATGGADLAAPRDLGAPGDLARPAADLAAPAGDDLAAPGGDRDGGAGDAAGPGPGAGDDGGRPASGCSVTPAAASAAAGRRAVPLLLALLAIAAALRARRPRRSRAR